MQLKLYSTFRTISLNAAGFQDLETFSFLGFSLTHFLHIDLLASLGICIYIYDFMVGNLYINV